MPPAARVAFSPPPAATGDRAPARTASRSIPWSLVVGALGVLVAVVTAWTVWWVWGGVSQPRALNNDEAAYLLQARIFAAGHWTAPGRPLPAFFEQWNVLVAPRLAAKYPPLHSALLALGVRSGAASSIILASWAACALGMLWLAGAMTRSRRSVSVALAVGLATWAAWWASPGGMHFRSSYFSQATSAPLVLLVWGGCALWLRSTSRGRGTAGAWLVGLAVLGLFLTRPMTALGVALPLLLLVLFGGRLRTPTAMSPARRSVGLPVMLATALGVLLIGVLWSSETTGRLTETPLARYARAYMPWDHVGFGGGPPPLVTVPAWRQDSDVRYRHLHEVFTPQSVLPAVGDRLVMTWTHLWGWAPSPSDRLRSLLFLGLGLLGLWQWRRWLLLPVAQCACTFLLYGLYAHEARWTLYYLEWTPLIVVAVVLGCAEAAAWGARRARRGANGLVVLALGLLSLWCVDRGVRTAALERVRALPERTMLGDVARVIDALPGDSVIAFVRPDRDDPNPGLLVDNALDLPATRVWVVHDLGAENAVLRRYAPGRTAYVIDVGAHRVEPLP